MVINSDQPAVHVFGSEASAKTCYREQIREYDENLTAMVDPDGDNFDNLVDLVDTALANDGEAFYIERHPITP